MKAREFIPTEKPRNFVAKNAKMGGAGQHRDKKKAEKQGDLKHKNKQFEQSVNERASQLLSAEDRNGVITVVVQAPDGTKRSLADENPRYINQWLDAKYGLTLPKSIMSKFVEQDVAEGKSGAKYKIKSIGSEGGKDYYISPNTGKKVYKKAKVGDHETPSGEHKPEVRMPYKENVADEGVLSFLKTEPEKKKLDPAKDSRVTSNKRDNDGWIKLLIDKHRRGIELTDREWNSIEQWKLKRAMGAESAQVQELSTDLLGRYKKAAGDQATAADKAGDYDKGHKRFKGIVKATNKQFDNDAKKTK